MSNAHDGCNTCQINRITDAEMAKNRAFRAYLSTTCDRASDAVREAAFVAYQEAKAAYNAARLAWG